MATSREVTFKLRRDTASDWVLNNPILSAGEPGFETDTGKFKMGDGTTAWTSLEYFINEEAIAALIVATIPTAGNLAAHIASLTPHPIYDEGPSLTLLYQNAKV